MKELDGLFLDLYGTLTAGDRQAVEATCVRIVEETGAGISAHELSIAWGDRFFHSLDFHNGDTFLTLFDLEKKTLVETMAALHVEVDPEPYVSQLSDYWRNPPLQPEVFEFLSELRYPVCIISNADTADAESAVASHGLKVDGLVTSEMARAYKPSPGIFEMALERMGWRRDRVIHIGDSLHSDVGGAILAGLRSGWVNRAHRIYDVGTHQPDHEFADLHDVLAWLKERQSDQR